MAQILQCAISLNLREVITMTEHDISFLFDAVCTYPATISMNGRSELMARLIQRECNLGRRIGYRPAVKRGAAVRIRYPHARLVMARAQCLLIGGRHMSGLNNL